ncbi:hypothetical protein M9194_14400 [Vibrio sp. S4M6]|uniref:hypothetical protein n=1 Tax=Vibrio sinus TaxID=2946865 RepID=UPI00202A6F39|nr:hypothetical protein [Vibrio sinus]MCL9782623.1 hypothetical protein [Vibrio sinus]
MFILISILVSFSILLAMMFIAKQRHTTFANKYEVVVMLREILLLIRQSRSHSHYWLALREETQPDMSTLEAKLLEKSNQLIAISPFDNKSNYRVFQLMLGSLGKGWQERSIARNQMIHGKAIRHCLFLIDEVVITWLVQAAREDLSNEYHRNWQQVADSMEVLTQLRISIQDIHSIEGFERSKFYCDKMRRKINLLSIISPLTLTSPACSKALHTLEELINNPEFERDVDVLYQLTSDISLNIARVYDQILSDLTEQLHQPLPRVSFGI